MAASVTRLYKENSATYDRLSGTYTARRVYHVNEQDPSESATNAALSNTTIPPFVTTYTIPHVEDALETVTMVPVARSARRVKGSSEEEQLAAAGSGSITEVTVEYEGHYIGEVSSGFSGSMTSGKLVVDQSGNQIGVNAEGTIKLFGQEQLTFVSNEDTSFMVSDVDDDRTVLGKVNEQGWNPTSFSRGAGTGWAEGSWLYVNYNVQENRDGTYTVTRYFLATSKRRPGGEVELIKNFYWQQHQDETESVTVDGDTFERVKRTYSGTDIISQVYPVAGAGGSGTFADITGIPVTAP